MTEVCFIIVAFQRGGKKKQKLYLNESSPVLAWNCFFFFKTHTLQDTIIYAFLTGQLIK